MFHVDYNGTLDSEEFARQIEQLNKLFPDQSSGGWSYSNIPAIQPSPCPSCGHCPTCGRNAQPSWPARPYISW